MTKIDNLNSGQLADILRRLKNLESAAPLNSTSIGSGGLRVYDGGVITIENGGLKVTGTAEIIGKLIASGFIEFNGPVKITGPFDIEGLTQIMGDLILKSGGKFTAGTIVLNPDGSAEFGTLTIDPDGTLTSGEATINPDGSATFGLFEIAENGDLKSKGTLDIEGKSTLKNDLEVKDGGKIKAGGVTIDPDRFNGGIVFSNGPYMAATSLGAQFTQPGGGGVSVSTNQADMSVAGGGAVMATRSGVVIQGIPQTSEKPNVYIDTNGNLKRSTAT